ncbi:MAG: hypothetical protein WA945_03130, partial [Arcobacteraceae bacterium]
DTIVEIIQRVEKLTQKKKSVVELDIQDIKEEIQETLFSIHFTPENICDQDTLNLEVLQNLQVTPKEALGLFFLTFVTTLRSELSYNSLWVGIEDALLEFEEDNNTFFVDHYFEESEPSVYLNEAIVDALKRFDLRDGYDNEKPTDTILLQMGILKRAPHINYWLTSNSKNSIVNELTNRTHENFSSTFNSGWKILQRYKQSIITQKEAIHFLQDNVWFKSLDLEELLQACKVQLHSTLISEDEIENNFFLEQVRYENNELKFILNGDDFESLRLTDESYDICVDGEFASKLIFDETTQKFFLENLITIQEPTNSKIILSIKDTQDEIKYEEEFVLFDFNHDILVFDEEGQWYDDLNTKLDETKNYSMLIDSDFDVSSDEENIYEYFNGYVHLITGISKDSNFTADDGEAYQLSLNFKQKIKTPQWLNNLELYAITDFLSFEEPLQYNLKYNNMTVSARQVDELIDIPASKEASIVRWSYSDGVIYDLDSSGNFTYDIDLSYDILLNRKNTIKIQLDGKIFTKQLNVTLIEKTIKPKYRTFLRDKNDSITFLNETNRLTENDIKNNQMIITSFHEDFITQPELKTQMLRDKSTIFESFTLNKFFSFKNYPYYTEEISSVRKIYDDVIWNTFCCISIHGIVSNYNAKTRIITLTSDEQTLNLSLITLDKSYTLKTQNIDVTSGIYTLSEDVLGFCLFDENEYVGSYFTKEALDIEVIFSSVEILKFLRVGYYGFAEFYNGTEYEKNRVLREKARNDKKKVKKLIREVVHKNPTTFLQAFMDDQWQIDNLTLNLHFDRSTVIAEQILFAVEFEADEAVKILHEIILNRWIEKMISFPMFLLYLLNIVKNERYYQIFLDELPQNIETPNDVDEAFIERMIKALLSNHKLDRYEKINIKTITQLENRDFYIQQAIGKLIELNTILVVEELIEE